MIVSDHSPCTPDLKLPGEKDFMQAWGGISSLQFGSEKTLKCMNPNVCIYYFHRIVFVLDTSTDQRADCFNDEQIDV